MTETTTPLRTIKSFVIRAGRMTHGQKQAIETGWKDFGLELEQGLLDYRQIYKRTAPVTLEIGFGMGQSLCTMAEQAPEQDFIGIEVHKPGVGALITILQDKQLNNVRVFNCDAIEALNNCIADNSLDRLLLFFPDPWHKKRHHKRRIVQPEFAQLVRSKLKVGGVFHMATDWQPYAEHMLEVMCAAEGYKNLATDNTYVPRPEERPKTKFETRGERLGHGVWDLKFQRIA
ncbi:tRNA (guanosine(46)-N7)-methyltransferase TrmB [Entomomonas sp. E2T0]|uniref:tRNA (guanosine(46)-N7)-methyltransferase TrmB n=1 Tax=Entomomonas sp. E2T0 TaxID=2930213 RepID=UPI00222818FC|nr:tRNA (guanosine(46)-N7)-methyltransferase TrmB [Entomomonas sp. E2T0]UYZ84048.1 tRNA (guanosine(46)-N7)-methyltransferase TrmB [Entomomonas sp. E2T0]